MIIKESQVGSLEQIMPTVYNKLQTLGEINNVVPLANIMKGLQSGEARAYVSNEDKNQDGIPDRINIVYPKMDIDLRQHLDGVTTADIMAFPNIDSQKAFNVMNIMGAVLEVLHHEQDHLSGFKSTEDSSGNITDEFSSESSADSAGGNASSTFINKWRGKFASTTNSYSNIAKCFDLKGEFKMQKDLVKLANHLDKIGHRDLADKLDSIVVKINKTAQFIITDEEAAAAKKEYGYSDEDWAALPTSEQFEYVDQMAGVASGAYPSGTVTLDEPTVFNYTEGGGQQASGSQRSLADDNAVTASSKLDGIFSVNPVGKVSR